MRLTLNGAANSTSSKHCPRRGAATDCEVLLVPQAIYGALRGLQQGKFVLGSLSCLGGLQPLEGGAGFDGFCVAGTVITDFQRPCTITDCAGAPAAVMRCARPTRPLCPEKLSPRPAAAAAAFTRRPIVDSLIPKAELSSPAPLRLASRACTVDAVTATTWPSPSWAVFERAIVTRPTRQLQSPRRPTQARPLRFGAGLHQKEHCTAQYRPGRAWQHSRAFPVRRAGPCGEAWRTVGSHRGRRRRGPAPGVARAFW